MKKFTGVVVAAGLGVFALVGCSAPEVIAHSEKEPEVVEEITEVAPPETTEVRPDTLEGTICTMFDERDVQTAWEIIYMTGIDSGLDGAEVVDVTKRALETECPEHIDAVIEGLE